MKFSLRHRIKKPVSGRHGTAPLQKEKSPLLILLHGVGGHEDDLMEAADQFDDSFTIISVRGPFEQSPTSFAWYRISPFLDERTFFVDDAEESRLLLIQFINEAVSNYDVDPQQVYLLGFGQGATVSLSVMLTEPGVVSGVVAISGEILPEVLHLRSSQSRLQEFPILLAYGLHDQILPIQDGRRTRDLLATFTSDLSYREYTIGHHLSPISLREAADWLTVRLDTHRQTRFADSNSKFQLGHVQLRVRDLDRSIVFYKRYLSLRVTERVGRAYAFLSNSYHHHDLALQHVGPEALDMPPNSIGVTNIAFEAVDMAALADVYHKLQEAGVPVRANDHFITWSIYFNDPDGNEIEVYCDTRDLPGRSDMWQGRDLPLESQKILSYLKNNESNQV
jgi:phospholipase/carboxylesterase